MNCFHQVVNHFTMGLPRRNNHGRTIVILNDFILVCDVREVEVAAAVLDVVFVQRTAVIQSRKVLVNVCGRIDLWPQPCVEKVVFQCRPAGFVPAVGWEVAAGFVNSRLTSKHEDLSTP